MDTRVGDSKAGSALEHILYLARTSSSSSSSLSSGTGTSAASGNGGFISDCPLSLREVKSLLTLANPLSDLWYAAHNPQVSVTNLLDMVTERFVTIEYLGRISKNKEEAEERANNIQELKLAAAQYLLSTTATATAEGEGELAQTIKDTHGEAEGEDEDMEQILLKRTKALAVTTDTTDTDVNTNNNYDNDYDIQSKSDLSGKNNGWVNVNMEGALPSGQITLFLEQASLVSDSADAAGNGDTSKKENSKEIGVKSKVFLTTIHASKGLEFDAVLLTGCEEGCLPITRYVRAG